MKRSMSLERRLARLEEVVAERQRCDPQRLHERRTERAFDSLERFLECIPEEREETILSLVGPPQSKWEAFHLDNRGMQMLFDASDSGFQFVPVPVPVVVVDAFLADDRLEPWLKCIACGLRLPYASGFWTRSDGPSFWQGPLVPFRKCPACGGTAAYLDGRVPDIGSYLPCQPDSPPWRLQTECPTDSRAAHGLPTLAQVATGAAG